jgi:hypothetical protein
MYANGPKSFDRTFQLEDETEHACYNLSYVVTIQLNR